MRKYVICLALLMAFLLSGCGQLAAKLQPSEAPVSTEAVDTLEDDKLYEALLMRFMGANPRTLNPRQLTVASIITFEAEMMNGGLCQFFVNDYSGLAQHVAAALAELEATQLQALYTGFLSDNKIDVTQMDSFRISSIEDYEAKMEEYPYDPFDEAFYELYQTENLYERLIAFVRSHSEEILT